jgi:hypothetical protein
MIPHSKQGFKISTWLAEQLNGAVNRIVEESEILGGSLAGELDVVLDRHSLVLNHALRRVAYRRPSASRMTSQNYNVLYSVLTAMTSALGRDIERSVDIELTMDCETYFEVGLDDENVGWGFLNDTLAARFSRQLLELLEEKEIP